MEKKPRSLNPTSQGERGSSLITCRQIILVASIIVLGLLLVPGSAQASTSNTIEGYVYQYGTTTGVSGLPVYLYYGSQIVDTYQTATSPLGHFVFQDTFIHPNDRYAITVNGADTQLGHILLYCNWGQWEGQVTTDSSGYAQKTINIEQNRNTLPFTYACPGVPVPLVAVFPNTQYVTLSFSTTSQNTVAQQLTLQVGNSGISTEGVTSQSISAQFQNQQGASPAYLEAPWTASSVWCDAVPQDLILPYCYTGTVLGVRSSGIVQHVPNQLEGVLTTTEYISPSTLSQNYADVPIASGYTRGDTFQETHTSTWSYTGGVPFAISYLQFGITIDLKVTATTQSSTTTSITWSIANTSANLLNFRLYPVWLDPYGNPKYSAAELHVWQYTPSSGGGGGGGCSPTSNRPVC